MVAAHNPTAGEAYKDLAGVSIADVERRALRKPGAKDWWSWFHQIIVAPEMPELAHIDRVRKIAGKHRRSQMREGTVYTEPDESGAKSPGMLRRH